MEVKTGTLRNNLSRYLKRVRQTGECIIVLDRDAPVAEIRPYNSEQSRSTSSVWASRSRFQKSAGALDEDFQLPGRITKAHKSNNPLD